MAASNNELPSRGRANYPANTDATTAPPPLRRHGSSLRLLTELSRERVALRYLNSWKDLYQPQFIERNAFPAKDLPMPEPAACNDTGLAAFAQLAALRIGVRRVFVTLMSRDTEYVLIESARSMSLQSDFTADEKDKSWLGTSCFTRTDGVNDKALDGWRRARNYREVPEIIEHYYTEGMSAHWCIISDLSTNAEFSQIPFVQRAKCPRFYFSIPLRDSYGAVMGSLSMLDDKPRYGISAQDMLFCEDLGDTIAQHLCHSMVSVQRQRSERLIQALGTFNEGGKSLKDWWIGQDDMSMQRGGRRQDNFPDLVSKSMRFEHEFGAEDEHSRGESPFGRRDQTRPATSIQQRDPRPASDGNAQATQDSTINHVSGKDFQQDALRVPSGDIGGSPRPLHTVPEGRVPSQPKKENGSRKTEDTFDATAQMKNTYDRASNLLREATGAFGVVFFDASAASAARPLHSPKSQSTQSSSVSSSNTIGSLTTSSDDFKAPTTSDTDLSDNTEQRTRLSKVVGRSTQAVTVENRANTFSPLKLNERDIARLIKAYPSGRVFNYTTTGTPYSGSEDSAGSGTASSASAGDVNPRPPRANTRHTRHARLLGKVVGEARSIAFYPIWDASNNRYRSCLFAWTLGANRFFDHKEDMTYLSAFSHSLKAEISRIETIASDVAKGKFISSMSHELRSPLHGVLGGIELLRGSQLSPFQEEMSFSVALAGRTLLDTVENILSYSKISNPTRAQKRNQAKVDASRHGSAEVEGDEYLSTVVDLARMTEEVVESVVSAHRFSRSLETKGDEQEPLSVVLNIDKRDSWATAMTPGSWTRVLTNIVGNALKYTPSGTVKVKLFTDQDHTSNSHLGGMTHVTLRVEDTGIGMSKDFISHDVFVPFCQADHHSAGTGLGLSIVKEIAKEFKGNISVESDLGKGSCVSVRFSATFREPPDATTDDLSYMLDSKARHLRMIYLADFLNYEPSQGTKNVADSLQQTASQWLGCEISSSREMTPGPCGSLCAVSETELIMLSTKRSDAVKALVDTLAESGSRLLILGRSIASCSPEFEFTNFKFKPLYIHQPIAPRKLSRVVKYAKDSTIIRQASDFASLNPIAQKQSPTTIRGDTSRPTPNSRDQGSYFETPSSNSTARSPSSLMTPGSLMQATTAESPVGVASVADPDRQIEMSKAQPASNTDRPRGDMIMLVEDNNINLRLLAALMKKQSLPYDSATDGLQAFNKYKENPSKWFVILMDMNMPVTDGFESTAKIREYERKNHLPAANICALTGVANEEARSQAFNAGVNKYLTKPIKMKDLTKIMAELRETV